jgi:ATP-dependent DNA helicase RecG
MALPVNIDELIHGNTVEWERLEFKQGWNPEDVIHTMCAFANDLHNWGNGYIIIGVAEINGLPVLPPAGLQQNQIDAIQKKVLELGHKMQPNYFPISQPYLLQGEHILVLWCPAGDNRVYTAPTKLGNIALREAYVRLGSNSVIAKGEILRQLQELTARIPFDDRINNRATLHDLDLGLIQAHLQEVKSDLFEESKSMSFVDLCRSMHIAKGASEDLRPVNVGLLFFSKDPERYFDRTQIELVWHQDDSGTNYKEQYFKGPVQKQLRDALSFLKTNIISEQVVKSPDKAEANRFYNFPYAAVEEALSNAIYHKSYELSSPIEIQVWPDKMEILSHPGPVPPVNSRILKSHQRIVAREYRNRRIGDFLKELHLTEGRGTGLPTIYKSMADNGSPVPVFGTDDQTYFLVTLPVHASVKSIKAGDQPQKARKKLVFNNLEDIITFVKEVSNQVSNQVSTHVSDQVSDHVTDHVTDQVSDHVTDHVSDQVSAEEREKIVQILTAQFGKYLEKVLARVQSPQSSGSILESIGLRKHTINKRKYIDPLLALGWVEFTIPENVKDRNQKYKLTQSGKTVLALLSQKQKETHK